MNERMGRSLAELRMVVREMHVHQHLTLPIDAVEKWAKKLKANLDILEREIDASFLECIEDFDDDFGHSPEDLNTFK